MARSTTNEAATPPTTTTNAMPKANPLTFTRLAAGTHQITCERPNETVSRSVEITPGAPNARVFFDEH